MQRLSGQDSGCIEVEIVVHPGETESEAVQECISKMTKSRLGAEQLEVCFYRGTVHLQAVQKLLAAFASAVLVPEPVQIACLCTNQLAASMAQSLTAA